MKLLRDLQFTAFFRDFFSQPVAEIIFIENNEFGGDPFGYL